MTPAQEELARKYLMPRHQRPPSPTRGVHHLAMICEDPARTIEFYQGILGFPLIEVMENRDYPGSTHFFFDLGQGNLLAFFDFPGLGLGTAVEAYGGVQHIALSIDRANFERLRSKLDQAGVEYIGPDRGLTNSIYFKDPDGIQVELLAEPLLQMDDRPLGG